MVLRPEQPLQASQTLEELRRIGWRHVEISWSPFSHWAEQMASLQAAFPSLAIGAAGVVGRPAITAAIAAGCRYAVSPVLEPEALELAQRSGLVLVPGVMTPSEVQQARSLGCRLVKLFPASLLGRDYWRQLRQPLGEPLPFCIAAGGLTPEQVEPWLQAGVDAVALGSSVASRAGVALRLGLDPLRHLLSARSH